MSPGTTIAMNPVLEQTAVAGHDHAPVIKMV
jgi:hypothetical protein